MWRSPRRRRPERALGEVTSFPGPEHGEPAEGHMRPSGRVPTEGTLGPATPSSAPNCGRKRSTSMQQCKRTHYHLVNMHEENALGWPSPITQLWPRHPIKRHIHLPRWMRRGRRQEGRSTGGRGRILERKSRENTCKEPERQTKKSTKEGNRLG